MNLKAVFFDFDGLIIDTETHEYTVWREIYSRHGAELSLSEWSVCIGTMDHNFDAVGHLQARTTCEIDRNALSAEFRSRYHAGAFSADWMEGFLDRLDEARALGLRRAIVSSSTSDWVLGHLNRRGLPHDFDLIQTSEEVERTKPDPALYRLALSKLRLQPHEVLAFEDSENGVKAAKAAGIPTIAVPNSVTRHFTFELADRVISSLAEIRLADWTHSSTLSH